MEISNSLFIIILQRDARGSITFKIVPSYRSAPPPCEVNINNKIKSFSVEEAKFVFLLPRGLLASLMHLCFPSDFSRRSLINKKLNLISFEKTKTAQTNRNMRSSWLSNEHSRETSHVTLWKHYVIKIKVFWRLLHALFTFLGN